MTARTKSELVPEVRIAIDIVNEQRCALTVQTVENASAEIAEKMKAALRDVAGGVSPQSRRSIRIKASGPPLVSPAYALLTRGTRGMRSVAGLVKPLADAVARGVAEVIQAKKEKFAPIVNALKNPSGEEWAAMLENIIFFAKRQGKRFKGQVADLSGYLFEELRKKTAEYLHSLDNVAGAVAESNRKRLGKAAAAVSESDLDKMVAQELRAGNTKIFRPAGNYDGVTAVDGNQLTDGMRLAFNGEEEVLILGWDEAKLKSVGRDALPQIDEDLKRILEGGIWLADGRFFPPGKIRFPPGGALSRFHLSAYIESAKTTWVRTPAGLRVRKVSVGGTEHLREFAEDLLKMRSKLKIPQDK